MPRVIYSLHFELEPQRPGTTLSLVVPLNADGQSADGATRPVPPKLRVIDLRVGDSLWFQSKVYKIVGVKAYREGRWPEGMRRSADGYEVREAG